MNSKRVYFLMVGLIALLFVGIFGGAYGVNSLLMGKSKKLVSLKLQDQVIALQQQGLVKAKSQVTQYSALEQVAKTIVPQDKNQAEAVLEITDLAAQSGISQLSSVAFPASTLGGVIAPAGTAANTVTPTNSAANNLTQLTPVKGISGVYQLQITITQSSDNTIPYSKFVTFLGKLEQNRRTAQVTSISLTPDTANAKNVAFTLVINEFIKP